MYHQIKELKKRYNTNGSNASDTEEVVLSKKPLGSYCASCDKELVNMRADSIGYSTWERFPMRDQSVRMKGNMRSPVKRELPHLDEEEEVKVQDNTLPKINVKPH